MLMLLITWMATLQGPSTLLPDPPKKKEIRAFYIGHSLSDGIPEMLWGMAESTPGAVFRYGYQRSNGAPLRHQWNQWVVSDNRELTEHTDREMMRIFDKADIDKNAHLHPFFDLQDGLPSGRYTHLVMTESVPRYYSEGWGNVEQHTYPYVDSIYRYARQFNPQIKPYLYEVWHCINSGTPTGCDHDKDAAPFRERLKKDLAMWESVVDHFNSSNPPQRMQLIPVGQGLGRLSDAIDRGEVPGIGSIREMFTDDIHVNDTLRYFAACIHYATLFEKSPVGLTGELKHLDGRPFVKLPKETAAILQKIAWQTVVDYRAGTRN